MDEINLVEIKPEKKLERWLQTVLLFFGDRLAIILFALFIPAIILFIHVPQAFSEQEDEVFVQPEASSWYTNSSFEISTESAQVSYSYSAATITPSPSPTPAPTSTPSSSSDVWDKLAMCESKGNWSINTGNGYYGGLQFSEGAWRSVGGSGFAHEASRDEQIMRGKMLQEKRGWGPWGGCSKKLGLL